MEEIFWSVVLRRSFCQMRRSVNKQECYGPGRGWLHQHIILHQTAILNGAINMLHNHVLLANHCLPLVMVSNASTMRPIGVVLCSVCGIRRSGRHVEAALLPWSYTSSCPPAVSVAIMGMLDRCCDHEAEWQESSGQWHFVGPSAKCADLATRKSVMGPVEGGFTSISSYIKPLF